MKNQNVLIIANPCSGKGKARKIAPKVAAMIAEAGGKVSLMFTEAQGNARLFAAECECDVIVVIGGDGTLNEVVSGVVSARRSDVNIGYVPMGSTNDFARSLKISRKWKKAVKSIIVGGPKAIDVCKFNDDYFTYAAAYGIFAETSCSVNQRFKNRFGFMAYVIRAAREVFRKNNFHVKLEVDGRVVDDYYALCGFTNTRSLGRVLKFKDSIVAMDDGVFEILLVKKPKNLWQLMRMLSKLSKSEWCGDGLEMIHAGKAKVIVEDEMLWSLDGEKRMLKSDIEIKNLHKAINIILN